jgi:hypothetical protein
MNYVALTPRNGKYPPAQSAARHRFEDAFLVLKPGPSCR